MLSIIFYLRLPVSKFVLCDLADRLAGPGEVVNTGLEVNTMARKPWWARSTWNMNIIFSLLKFAYITKTDQNVSTKVSYLRIVLFSEWWGGRGGVGLITSFINIKPCLNRYKFYNWHNNCNNCWELRSLCSLPKKQNIRKHLQLIVNIV